MASKLKHQPSPIAWELDSRSTRFLFDAAKEKAAEAIQRLRAELITLEHFDPLPQLSRDGNLVMYDGKTKADLLAEKRDWLAYYERIHSFCLRAEEVVGNFEAERFASQMAEMFRERKAGD